MNLALVRSFSSLFQLLAQQALGRVLQGFSEGEIHFPPTYKFDLVSGSYYIA